MPEMAGTVSGMGNCVAMTAGSLSSAAAAVLFDGRTALSIAGTMTFCAFLALMALWLVIRHSGQPAILRSRET
jgi:DHA1 family bicyclomycin/chloramphenicol resistance-like MFS transporter